MRVYIYIYMYEDDLQHVLAASEIHIKLAPAKLPLWALYLLRAADGAYNTHAPTHTYMGAPLFQGALTVGVLKDNQQGNHLVFHCYFFCFWGEGSPYKSHT